jgi:exopolyphosphatase/guanosine-5'-triphosphate,3'-diphosphate pyrophosphatase
MQDRRSAAPDLSPGFPLRVGVVDMGSNAIRFVVADFIAPTTWTALVSERVPVRLADRVSETGLLSEEAMDAAVAVMARFRDALAERDVRHYRAVATSAVRESGNRRALVKLVRERTGLRLEVISGAEEARLVHQAARTRVPMGNSLWLMADLGGGSLEIAIVDGEGIKTLESFAIGTVRLLEEFRSATGGAYRIRRLLDEYVAGLRFDSFGERPQLAGYIATGGNIDDLARVAGASPDDDGVYLLDLDDLKKAIETLSGMTIEERIEEFELRENRADVIVPAAMIYARLAERFGVSRIHVPNVGVKEGAMIDLVDDVTGGEGHGKRRVREVVAGAVALGRRFHFEERHGVHVARLSELLFDALAEDHDLDERDREILVAAAILHDIGQRIAYKRHHNHSYYLISESELPGLDLDEVELVANVARYHRRADPSTKHPPFEGLSEEDQERVTKLSAILRVADAFDREHVQNVRDLAIELDDEHMEIELEGEGDFELERWALERKKGLFEKTFGLEIVLANEAVRNELP